MSLSDRLKVLRALHGGVTPLEIQEATGVTCAVIGEIETKYRRVGDDDAALASLAGYFGVPLADLQGYREWFRKRLTAFLAEMKANAGPVRPFLVNGGEIVGQVLNADKSVIRLKTASDDDELLILRHAVDRWEVASPSVAP